MRPTALRPLSVVLLSVALAGCADDEPVADPLPPLPSASVSSTPSPTPSPSPSLTEEQAVEAAVRFYYEGYGRAFAKMDAEELARGSARDCECRRVVARLADLLAKGDTVTGGEVIIESLTVTDVLPNLGTVNISLDSRDGEILKNGMAVESLAGEGKARKAVFLKKVDGRWLPFRIEALRG